MHRDFGGGHREDQPTVASVTRSQVEDVSERPTISISVPAVQDQMGTQDRDSYWLIRSRTAPSLTDAAPDPNEGTAETGVPRVRFAGAAALAEAPCHAAAGFARRTGDGG